MTTFDRISPPRPGAALRIGVTGHRPGDKLPAERVGDVRQTVDGVLAELERLARGVAEREAWAFADTKPALSVISSLAEGADRIVAHGALAAGFGLRAVLPFPREAFRADFATRESLGEYGTLLARAQAVFELDGRREAEARAYEAAGLVMLANCDILLAIWDQMPADGIGGTAMIVERALVEGVPVILIDPRAPDAPSLLWRADAALPTAREGIESVARRKLDDQLAAVVDILLSPPADARQRQSLKLLYAEAPYRWTAAVFYPLLLFLLGVRAMRWTDIHAPPPPADDKQGYWAIDWLSSRYGQIYRSAYVFNYLAGAAAVLLATVGLLYPDADKNAALQFKAIMVTIEVGLIGSILMVLGRGTRGEWHRRWLEYRRLEEMLRHLRILAPTGAAARLERPSGKAGSGWVSWYARAMERAIAVPDAVVDRDYLAALRDKVSRNELRAQIEWNRGNALAMERAGARLHLAGTCLFWATLVICVGFLVLYFAAPDRAERLRAVTEFLTALFPAIGAALSAIRSQADFETVAKRCHDTARDLARLDEAVRNEPLEFAKLTDRIEKAVDVLMDDTAEWHVLFRTRPLSLPA